MRTIGRREEAPGHLRLGPMPPGRYDLVVRAPDRLPWLQQNVEVPREGTDLGVVALVRSAFAVGRVVDGATGRPVVGATVRVAGDVLESVVDAPRTATDRDGRFRVGPLRPGPFELRLTKVGYAVRRLNRQVEGHADGQGSATDEPVRLGLLELRPQPQVGRAGHASPGLGVRGDRQGVRVAAVVPGSAADEAGVKRGARLLSVDGYAVEDVPPEDVVALLHGERGTSVVVEVATDGPNGVAAGGGLGHGRRLRLERR